MFDTRIPHMQTVIDGHAKVLKKATQAIGRLTDVIEGQETRIHALENRVRILETQNGNER